MSVVVSPNVLIRQTMVEGQLRPNRITDARILQAMLTLPREIFLPPELHALAYSDANLPLGVSAGKKGARCLLSPQLMGTLLQAAEIEEGDTVLVAAGGVGCLAALAERLKTTVFIVDFKKFFSYGLEQTIVDLQLDGCVCLHGDPALGWAQDAPYRVIIIDGAVREVPSALLRQLAVGGRLVALRMQKDDTGEIVVWQKQADGSLTAQSLRDGQAPLLAGFHDEDKFVF